LVKFRLKRGKHTNHHTKPVRPLCPLNPCPVPSTVPPPRHHHHSHSYPPY
jgi:hypothetical protein